MRKSIIIAVIAIIAFMSSCGGNAQNELVLATTTSTQDSGLLDVLIPEFEKQSGYAVKTIAVGSGQAMAMGRRGEADVLLVHSPAEEKNFMAEGFGADRRIVMHNIFMIAGPSGDPAGISACANAVEAFKKINSSKSVFVSRGDKSGTHSKELGIWKSAGIAPEPGEYYLETGQGMGSTLMIASEKFGYTLTDNATFLAFKDKLALSVFLKNDTSLLNVYHVITINPERFKGINSAGAKAFAEFITSAKTQNNIAEFGKGRFGVSLFVPDAPVGK
ncbi:MAG: substrate-binding domain-containing protein [Planctomycetes bacterium]|nr:substrate-binding domain-containing protein [Planctomycetota bacterium]